MTHQTPLTFTPADMRRATALMAHHAAGDPHGAAEIWREAAEVADWPGLAAAVIAVTFEVVPALRTEQGVTALRELARAYAAAEAADG